MSLTRIDTARPLCASSTRCAPTLALSRARLASDALGSWPALGQVCEDFSLETQIAGVAVSYFDCSVFKVGGRGLCKKRVQLLVITCVLIAAKFAESKMPGLDDLCEVAHNKYSKDELKSMENAVLGLLASSSSCSGSSSSSGSTRSRSARSAHETRHGKCETQSAVQSSPSRMRTMLLAVRATRLPLPRRAPSGDGYRPLIHPTRSHSATATNPGAQAEASSPGR